MANKRLLNPSEDPQEVSGDQLTVPKLHTREAPRLDVTFCEAWTEYVDTCKPYWSEQDYLDHIHHGCEKDSNANRGRITNPPGSLAILCTLKLSELTAERIAQWHMSVSAHNASTSVRSFRLLRGFLRWAERTPHYKGVALSDTSAAIEVIDAARRTKAGND